MKRFFDNELETFRSHLMLMGESSIRQVRLALKALVDGDAALADQVIAADDEIDRLEMQIDNEAIAYMNLRAPVATELRLVIVGMKASHDLERVGDEATSIAKRAVRLAAEPPLKPYVDIPRMANIALEMLRDALVCFLHGVTDKALADATTAQANAEAAVRRNKREAGELMPTIIAISAHDAVDIVVRQKICASSMTENEKDEILADIESAIAAIDWKKLAQQQ